MIKKKTTLSNGRMMSRDLSLERRMDQFLDNLLKKKSELLLSGDRDASKIKKKCKNSENYIKKRIN